jgi:PPOX class probable F420-dependent enzyme
MLDLTTERDAHIDQRQRSDNMIWLTTVRRDGCPHTVPVWFLWDGKTILILNQPDTVKIRTLRTNPNVTLALDGTREGGDVVVLEGRAEVLTAHAGEIPLPDYFTKYGTWIQRLGQTPEGVVQSYSQPIRITPTKCIGWKAW